MPRNYIALTVRYRDYWLKLNLAFVFAHLLMAALGVIILVSAEENCGGLKQVGWFNFFLHVLCFTFSSMALCGLEKRLLNKNILIGFLVLNAIILVWSQATYFESQYRSCNVEAPGPYFWMMSEIMFFYFVVFFMLCYFIRRFCQNPKL